MNKVKFYRIEIGLSQIELAFAANVPRWAIQLAESGVRLPTSDQQLAIANALGVPLHNLFPTTTNKQEAQNGVNQ